MNKALKVLAGIAIALAALAILEPQLYNDLLDAIVHLLTSIRK